MTDAQCAARVMERCEALGRISEESDFLVRPYGSEALRRANDTVAGWMREAGMVVHSDVFGNLVGRYEGIGNETLLLGSHPCCVSPLV